MIELLLKKLRRRDDVSAQEEQVLRKLVSHKIKVPADKVVISAGDLLNESLILLNGWMARAKDLPSGQRQYAELHIPGDFVDLHSFSLKRLDHDIIAFTPCDLAVVPHERLQQVTEQYPHLTRVLWFMTNLDAAIHREWTLSMGRRTAIARMAHLFCELLIRLDIAGLTIGEFSYDFPLTQAELGECLSLTPVHVNRTIQDLRRRNLISLESRRVDILDFAALKGLAEFEDTYLYLEKMAH